MTLQWPRVRTAIGMQCNAPKIGLPFSPCPTPALYSLHPWPLTPTHLVQVLLQQALLAQLGVVLVYGGGRAVQPLLRRRPALPACRQQHRPFLGGGTTLQLCLALLGCHSPARGVPTFLDPSLAEPNLARLQEEEGRGGEGERVKVQAVRALS